MTTARDNEFYAAGLRAGEQLGAERAQATTSAKHHFACPALGNASDYGCACRRSSDATACLHQKHARRAASCGDIGSWCQECGAWFDGEGWHVALSVPRTDYAPVEEVDEARRNALDEERANIVTWLREIAEENEAGVILQILAERIEAGEHVPARESEQKRGEG